jgi:hypothetical protein
MRNKILSILLCGMFMLGIPMQSIANSAIEIMENDFQNVSISVNQSTLHVVNANGQTLEIYNVAGVKVMNIKIEGNDKKYELNLPKGCYIVKIGKLARKISIK